MDNNNFHLAIIPDGNRRWGRQRGITDYRELYNIGFDRLFDMTEAAFEKGVSHLSVWASSYSNLTKRSSTFFKATDQLYFEKLVDFSNHALIKKFDVRINVLGEWRELLSKKTIVKVEKLIADNQHRTGRKLTFFIGYSGQRERGAALINILKKGETTPKSFDEGEALLHANSWSANLPPVDLIIRTGSWQDPHNSAGFLSLLTSESQLYFPEKYWPEFDTEQLTIALDDFKNREIRKGK